MKNISQEQTLDNFTDLLKFSFEQSMKSVFICIPGIIESYEPTTKRATVKPAIRLKKTDGTTLSQSSIVNVPVVFPSGGGFSLVFPLPIGSPVAIFFSQRGLSKFKTGFEESDPDSNLFDKSDAFIIPGFGGLSITPASSDGASLQSEDGQSYIAVESGAVKIENATGVQIVSALTGITGDVNITGNLVVTGTITGGTLASSGGSILAGGKDIGAAHVHSGVTSGPSNTGGVV